MYQAKSLVRNIRLDLENFCHLNNLQSLNRAAESKFPGKIITHIYLGEIFSFAVNDILC